MLQWALQDWAVEGDAGDNARLVLSEMVTNSLTHSLDVFRLALHLQGDQILVEVWDCADGVPDVGLPQGLAISGRGMFLVDALISKSAPTTWLRVVRLCIQHKPGASREHLPVP